MRSVGLDAAALGTLVHHLSWFELQALDEFFRSVAFGHGSLSEKRGGGEEKMTRNSVSVTADVLQCFLTVVENN